MRQLNGFWNWRQTNMLTHVQADLYFALLGCANAARWRSPLSIPNSTLIGMCQISRTELHRQRLALVQKGLIEYSKGHKGTAGKYIISLLYETKPGTDAATNPGTNPGVHYGNIYKKKTKTKTNTSPRNASYDIEELEALINRPIFDDGGADGKNQ